MRRLDTEKTCIDEIYGVHETLRLFCNSTASDSGQPQKEPHLYSKAFFRKDCRLSHGRDDENYQNSLMLRLIDFSTQI